MIVLKREIREVIVLVMRANTHIQNAYLKRNFFEKQKCCAQKETEKIWNN